MARRDCQQAERRDNLHRRDDDYACDPRPRQYDRYLLHRYQSGHHRAQAGGRGTVPGTPEARDHGAHQMLQTILDTIPQRVFWKDRNCTYLGCNRILATDAGLNSPAEIIGKSDFDRWSEMAEVYRADDKLVMEQGSAKLGYEEVQDR